VPSLLPLFVCHSRWESASAFLLVIPQRSGGTRFFSLLLVILTLSLSKGEGPASPLFACHPDPELVEGRRTCFTRTTTTPYRRCAQDRLAETIVVTERAYQQRFPKALGTPPEAEALPVEEPARTVDPAPSS